jgi:hypothetical protein
MQRTDHVPEAGRSSGPGEPRGTGSFDLGTGYDRSSTDPEAAREAGDTAGPAFGTSAGTEAPPVPAPRESDDLAVGTAAVPDATAEADRDAERAEDSRTDEALPGETSTGPASTDETSPDQTSSDQASTDQPSTDETSTDEASTDTAPSTDEVRAEQERADRERAGVHRAPGSGEESRLFTSTQSTEFRGRWREVQAGFVDDPAAALTAAEALLAEVTATLDTAVGARSTTTDTEVMRNRLRSYRAVVERILES